MGSHIFTATKVRLKHVNMEQKKRDHLTESLLPKIHILLSKHSFFFNNFDFLSQINSQAVKWAYDSGTSQHNPDIFSWMQLQS